MNGPASEPDKTPAIGTGEARPRNRGYNVALQVGDKQVRFRITAPNILSMASTMSMALSLMLPHASGFDILPEDASEPPVFCHPLPLFASISEAARKSGAYIVTPVMPADKTTLETLLKNRRIKET